MRCAVHLPPPFYNSITVDMLFNIVGHKIIGNYESWEYMGQTTERDRLVPGRGPYFPHPVVRRFFGAVQIMHLLCSYFHTKTVNKLIEDTFLYYNVIIWGRC